MGQWVCDGSTQMLMAMKQVYYSIQQFVIWTRVCPLNANEIVELATDWIWTIQRAVVYLRPISVCNQLPAMNPEAVIP